MERRSDRRKVTDAPAPKREALSKDNGRMRVLGRRPEGLRLERIQASPRWRGGAFRNLHPVLPGLRDANAPFPSLRDFLGRPGRRVPPGPLPAVNPLEAWTRRPATGLRATWLGHSTVLIEIDGLRVLTDPVWGARASPLRLAGPKRFQPVPVRLRALPPVDVVLITHDHYDHLDYPTIRALARTGVPFVTSLGVGAHLESWGVPAERIVELDWWESHTLPGAELTITAAPSQHFSGRGLKDRNATLWSSLAVRSRRHAVFFSGDTGLTTEYRTIRERLGPFDLVMLEVGAFHPAWGDIHLGPENALEALALLGGGALLPVHWGTFSLAMHAWDDPAETLLALAPRRDARLVMPRLGEPVEPARVERVVPWWRGVDQRTRVGKRTGAAESTGTAERTGGGEARGRAAVAPAEAARTRSLPWPLD
jgi:L-ascorbate metabolism protein UlaG (beta-lactamase superfamily)